MSIIYCYSMSEFIEVIAGLSIKGITFTADANILKITLTGGF